MAYMVALSRSKHSVAKPVTPLSVLDATPPLYRLKTPSQQIVMVLTALAEGLDPSAAERVFGYRRATITTWLTRAGEYAQPLHEPSFRNLCLPHLRMDEL